MQQERLEQIIGMIDREGVVKAQSLAQRFDVSMETIRRDLEKLESEGYVRRVHGGAVGLRMHVSEKAYQARRQANTAEKHAIAKEAAALINAEDVVLITPGTTTLETATYLREKSGLTVVTNSLPIALELTENPEISVYCLGGRVKGDDYSGFGIQTLENLKCFNPNKLIIGIGGITVERGLTDYRMEESAVLRNFTEAAECVIAVGDSSKFGIVATYNVCPAKRLSHLITDRGLSQREAEIFREEGIEVHLV